MMRTRRRPGASTLAGVAALILTFLVGTLTAIASDEYSSPNINFPGNVTLDRVATGFAENSDNHLANVVYVTATVQGCTNRVYRVDSNRNRTLFATLPGCTTIEVTVNTDGTNSWLSLGVFISQGNDIWIVPRGGPSGGFGTALTTSSVEHFTTLPAAPSQPGEAFCPTGITAMGLDTVRVSSNLLFDGNLIVQCGAKFMEVTPGPTPAVLPLPDPSGSGFGTFGFAPLNWRQQSGKVVVFNSQGNLLAISRTGVVSVVSVPALAGSTVRAYGIPGVYLPLFSGETGAFAASVLTTLQRWTWTLTNPADARGGVLLWANGTGARVIVYRDTSHVPAFASMNDPASGSDGDWSALSLQNKDCNPAAFEKNNTGSKGNINCVAYSTAGFDAATDIDWSAPDPFGVYCGVYGGVTEARASPKGSPKDVDGDGDLDQPFTFDAKDAPLLAETPGAVPFCTFHYTNPHGGGM